MKALLSEGRFRSIFASEATAKSPCDNGACRLLHHVLTGQLVPPGRGVLGRGFGRDDLGVGAGRAEVGPV